MKRVVTIKDCLIFANGFMISAYIRILLSCEVYISYAAEGYIHPTFKAVTLRTHD